MDSKIILPESVWHDEVVDYLASRYSITPDQVIHQFLYQDGVIDESQHGRGVAIPFEENEMAILRDMGLRPSCVEFVETSN